MVFLMFGIFAGGLMCGVLLTCMVQARRLEEWNHSQEQKDIQRK